MLWEDITLSQTKISGCHFQVPVHKHMQHGKQAGKVRSPYALDSNLIAITET